MKASYEKVWTVAASRCQVGNVPTKMKLEPGLDQQTASADAIGAGATGGDALETATAISEWQKPLPSSNIAQTALHPSRWVFIPSRAAKMKRIHHICIVLEILPLCFHQIISPAASEGESRNKPLLP